MYSLSRHIRQSLSMKIGLGILLFAVPIFVVSLGALYLQSRYNVKREAMERANSVLWHSSQRVKRCMNIVSTATNVTDWLISENLRPDSLLAYSRRIVMLNGDIDGCSITTEPNTFPQYGRYFSAYTVREGDSVITVREGEYEYFEKEWYKTPRQKEEACWTDPFDDYNEGTLSAKEPIVSYCKPLYDGNSRFFGVIASDLSLQRLAKIITAEKPYPNSYFIMIGEDGRYFIHPDTTRLFDQTLFSDADPRWHADLIALGHEMTGGKQGSMKVVIDEAPCLVCYMPVSGTQWSLALVCPESDILKGYNRLTFIIVPLIIIGLILIFLLCLKIVTHAIAPINQLVNLSQRLAAGHYDEQSIRSQKPDEIGQLQNSFVTMQESLKRHISDIRQVNEQTKQRNEELAKANVLVEEAARQKSLFIQNMTHQIRTPLNIIIGFAQILRDSLKMLPEEELKSVTGMMDHNAKHLTRMVQMLTDSSAKGMTEELYSHKDERVFCNEVIREAIKHIYEHFPELHIGFETELSDTQYIHTNHIYLMRSLREILYNSAKYSDCQHVLVKASKTKTTVRFTFEDTGPGIAESNYASIFEPFTKIDDLSEGLGLGLPLAKRHILNLGGDLTLDTNYHEGCRFIVDLPKK